jgi:hypothetical protein
MLIKMLAVRRVPNAFHDDKRGFSACRNTVFKILLSTGGGGWTLTRGVQSH